MVRISDILISAALGLPYNFKIILMTEIEVLEESN